VSAAPRIARIGRGVYRVEEDGGAHLVFVAGSAGDRWVYWRGRVFHRPFQHETAAASPARPSRGTEPHQSLSAPMPSTVLKILVAEGAPVRKGDTLLILEAMKMELPVRSASAGVVKAVRCREGELVQPGMPLVELE
jgi:3-methylcrotonyl-CoA carboxylase alpha subunit